VAPLSPQTVAPAGAEKDGNGRVSEPIARPARPAPS
jgi:hypothetical protein